VNVADAASKPCTGEVPTVEDALRRHAAESTFELRAATTRLDRNRVGSKKTCLPQIVVPSVILHLAKAPRRSL
jgi:hypothetical protein